MKFPALIVFAAAALVVSESAAAEKTIYECDTDHSARITGGHPQAAGPKIGSADDPDTVFAIEISSPKPVASCAGDCKLKQTVREVPTKRSRKSGYDLCESGGNYVLMHAYSAQAMPDEYSVDFRSEKDLGFLRLIGPFDHGDSYLFWQSGFEYPGCEDTHLVIRKGECRRRKGVE